MRFHCPQRPLDPGDQFPLVLIAECFNSVDKSCAPEIGMSWLRSVFERYNIVSERDLHEAARKLEAYVSEQNCAAKPGHTLGTPDDNPKKSAGEKPANLS